MCPSRRPAITLIELLVVMVVLIALAGLIVPLLTNVRADAAATTTRASLQQLADAINRYRADNAGILPRPGFVGTQAPNDRPVHPQMRYLFVNPGSLTAFDPLAETSVSSFNPFSRIGWNGPYLLNGTGTYTLNATSGFTNNFGNAGDPCVLDGWGNPIVLVTTTDGMIAWLQSAGPNGILEVPSAPTAAPVPSGNGSLFGGATGPVDDLTYVVLALR